MEPDIHPFLNTGYSFFYFSGIWSFMRTDIQTFNKHQSLKWNECRELDDTFLDFTIRHLSLWASILLLTGWSWLYRRAWRWPSGTDSRIDPWCHRGRGWCWQSPTGEERAACHYIITQVPFEPGTGVLYEYNLAWLLSSLLKGITLFIFFLWCCSGVSMLLLIKISCQAHVGVMRWRCALKAVSERQKHWQHKH